MEACLPDWLQQLQPKTVRLMLYRPYSMVDSVYTVYLYSKWFATFLEPGAPYGNEGRAWDP
jgi:hypothetical protein